MSMQRPIKKDYQFFGVLWKRVLYWCSKRSHGVVSRLWFGMLVRSAPSMYKKSFNCYVTCLHMWLLSVNSLYMYPNVFSIVLDFAGHSWMTWQLKKQMFCAVLCNAYALWCFVIFRQLLFYSFFQQHIFIFVGNKFMQRQS